MTQKLLVFVARYSPWFCLALVLLWTFDKYTYSYFWLDDFNNLRWAQTISLPKLLLALINPASDFYRPGGMIFYWMLGKTAGLEAWPYHFVAWSVHSLNTALLYAILRTVYRSPAAAAFGSLLFTFNPVFNQIYWSFGTIFELVCASLFFSGMLAWLRLKPPLLAPTAAIFAYYLAVKSKEIAIMFPVLWLLPAIRRKIPAIHLIPLGLIAIWFIVLRTSGMRSSDATHPYFMDFSLDKILFSYQWYLEQLFRTELALPVWILGGASLAGILWLCQAWRPLFFLALTLALLGPVIPLINHRADFYWYLPMLGVAGLLAGFVRPGLRFLQHVIGRRKILIAGSLLFPLFCVYYVDRQKYAPRGSQMAQERWAVLYESFVTGLARLPPPPGQATIHFTSYPEHFSETTLVSLVRVVFSSNQQQAKIVPDCPSSGYCVGFGNGRLIVKRWSSEASSATFSRRLQ